MKMLCLTIFACLACCPCSPQVHLMPINAIPSGDVLLRDPADTQRIVGATRLVFGADKAYGFTVRYSGQDTFPPLRLTIYEVAQHEAAADCTRVLCWTEWMFSSSGVDKQGKTIQRKLTKGTELLVIAWQGGNSKSRGGDPVSVDCGGLTICGSALTSTSGRSKLELSLRGTQQSVSLGVEGLD